MAVIGGILGSHESFRDALRRFSCDSAYVARALNQPSLILQDFPALSMQDLDSLRDAAVLSGVDVSSIDPIIDGVASRAGATPTLGGDGCCCCCCCGVTGVIERR